MVYVTHDQVEAMTLADRICVLRDGLVEQVGTPAELYEHPQTTFVAGFISSPKMDFITGKHAENLGVHTVGVRPEDLEIFEGTDDIHWDGEVIHLENIGSDIFIYVGIGEEMPLLVRQSKASLDIVGTKVSVRPSAKIKLHTFDEKGKAISTRD